MIISTTGFSGSGSSAVNEFLAEFNENQIYSKDEFIIAYCPDGIEDLDFHLNNGASKFLSSCVAIPRFRKEMRYRLGDETRGEIDRITDDYLNKLIQASWIGTGQGQEVLHNSFIYKNLGIRIGNRLSKIIPRKYYKKYRFYPLGIMDFSIEPECFYEYTKDYIDRIMINFGLDPNRNIVLDQAFAGNNPAKSFPYFRDPRAIVVDRDPRDMYVLFKFVDRISYAVPTDNVETFVQYYYNMHKSLTKNTSRDDVLLIRFENMIYNYDKTTKNIIDFLNLHEHSNPKKYFVPEESMINTQVFKRFPEASEDIKYIEKHLTNFLFDFDKYPYEPTKNEIFIFNPKVEHGVFSLRHLFGRK